MQNYGTEAPNLQKTDINFSTSQDVDINWYQLLKIFLLIPKTRFSRDWYEPFLVSKERSWEVRAVQIFNFDISWVCAKIFANLEPQCHSFVFEFEKLILKGRGSNLRPIISKHDYESSPLPLLYNGFLIKLKNITFCSH